MKKISQLVLILIIVVSLTSCYDRRDIDDLAYVIALGIDKGEQKELKITFQIAIPKNIGGGGSQGGGGKGGEKKFTIVTVESPTVVSAINAANILLSRQISTSHCQVIVFSEEIARQGIIKYLQNFQRIREFRPNMHITVSKCNAKDYLESIDPKLETNPAKYYEGLFRTYKYSGAGISSRFHEVYYNMRDTSNQAVATYVTIKDNKGSAQINSTGDSVSPSSDSELIQESEYSNEKLGIVAFKNDKMVGRLNWKESTYYLMVSGEYNYSYWTIPDPKSPDSVVVIRARQNRSPIKSVNIKESDITINTMIFLEGDITVIRSLIPYEDNTELKLLENHVSGYIKTGLIEYFKKTSEIFQSDINNFGNIAKVKFMTLQEWKNYNWSNKYKNAKFNANVEFKIRRPGLILNSSSNKEFEKGK